MEFKDILHILLVIAVLAITVLIWLLVKKGMKKRAMYSIKDCGVAVDAESKCEEIRKRARANAKRFISASYVNEYGDRLCEEMFLKIVEKKMANYSSFVLNSQVITAISFDGILDCGFGIDLEMLDSIKNEDDAFAYISAISQKAYQKLRERLYDYDNNRFSLTIHDGVEQRTVANRSIIEFSVYLSYTET